MLLLLVNNTAFILIEVIAGNLSLAKIGQNYGTILRDFLSQQVTYQELPRQGE